MYIYEGAIINLRYYIDIYAILYIVLVYIYVLFCTCSRHYICALQRKLHVFCLDITLTRRGMCM